MMNDNGFKNFVQKITTPEAKIKWAVAAKCVLYALTLPLILLLTLLLCVKFGEGVSFYSFWPYVPLILMSLLAMIFLATALVLNRKRSKKSRMSRTAILMVVCMLCTGFMGFLLDVIVPDVMATATYNTLYIEDFYTEYDDQIFAKKKLMRDYVRLSLLSGNYDGAYSYDVLTATDTDGAFTNAEIKTVYDEYAALDKEEINRRLAKMDDLDREFFEWTYENYILLDYRYAGATTSAGVASRRAVCMALTKYVSAEHSRLCAAGIKTSGIGAAGATGDPRMSWIFNTNYVAMCQDGFNNLDDNGLMYVTSGRMTVPAVVRLLFDDQYTASQTVYDDANNAVGYEARVVDEEGNEQILNGYLLYQYNPEIANEYTGAYDENGRSPEMFTASDGKLYYAYSDGHTQEFSVWCILDMLGDPIALLSMDIDEGYMGIVGAVLTDDMMAKVGELLNENVEAVLEGATGEEILYLHVYFDDEGELVASLYSSIIEKGTLGFLPLTWLQVDTLLIAVGGLISLRELLYIFGAFSIVMLFAAGALSAKIDDMRAALAFAPATAAVEDEPKKDD